MERERSYNARQAGLFALDGLPEWTGITAPEDQVTEVRRLQVKLGLKSDGMLGPKTIRAIGIDDHRQIMSSGEVAGAIIVGPRAYPVPYPVRQFVDHNLRDDLRGVARRTHARNIVLHHSVTFDNQGTYNVLERRTYSTHFAVEWNGNIDQYLDPATMYALHVGGVDTWDEDGDRISGNPHSVGIDFSSPAIPEWQERHVRTWGEPRPYDSAAEAHGRIVEYEGWPGGLGYSEHELRAVAWLVEVLCRSMKVPKVCPADETNLVPHPLEYVGVCKHLQLTKRKSDPIALDLRDLLDDRWLR